jgi:hypothetical protein
MKRRLVIEYEAKSENYCGSCPLMGEPMSWDTRYCSRYKAPLWMDHRRPECIEDQKKYETTTKTP